MSANPINRHHQLEQLRPKSAKLGLMQRCKSHPYSITSSALNKEGRGHIDAKCLSCLQIDDRLEPRGLLYRKIGRPGASQDLVDIARAQTPLRIKIEAE
jgi:hypothetical protein